MDAELTQDDRDWLDWQDEFDPDWRLQLRREAGRGRAIPRHEPPRPDPHPVSETDALYPLDGNEAYALAAAERAEQTRIAEDGYRDRCGIL